MREVSTSKELSLFKVHPFCQKSSCFFNKFLANNIKITRNPTPAAPPNIIATVFPVFPFPEEPEEPDEESEEEEDDLLGTPLG